MLSDIKVLIIKGFGLNCEAETANAFHMCGVVPDLIHFSDIVNHKNSIYISNYQILVMVGGFSFGDHLGAGIIYANRIRYLLHDDLQSFIEQGGLILGICNGFQTLVKLGLLPGFDKKYNEQTVTLSSNDHFGYRDAWVKLKIEKDSPCIWTNGITNIELSSRHGEGKFLTLNSDILKRIESEKLVCLRYVDNNNNPTQKWSDNPNNSTNAIAGICDPSGRILGMMPHPESYLYGINHPKWQFHKIKGSLSKEGAGLQIFRNGIDFARSKL